MRPHLVFLLAWLDAGLGSVLGSMIGNPAGRIGLLMGGLAGGLIGVWLGVQGAVKWKWLPPELRRGALWGAVIGYAAAAPIALANLHTPVIPLMVCGLVGAGALIGAGAVRRQT